MNKQEWENLKEGDSVQVKHLDDILPNLSGSSTSLIGIQKSNITNIEDAFMREMEKFCGVVFVVKEFYCSSAGENGACILTLGVEEYNFIPEWLDVVAEEDTTLDKIHTLLEEALTLCSDLSEDLEDKLISKGVYSAIDQAHTKICDFVEENS